MAGDVLSRWAWPRVLLPVGGESCATLAEDWTVRVRGRELVVPAGTRTDGASIPRFLWAVCGHPLASPRVYAALVHDWIYTHHAELGISRAEADAIYRELLVRFGWGRWRAAVEFVAVRLFGGSHWAK